ncbi:MAG: hypothetical protein M9916_02550 [Crocinitomicaceae bacterium]|nr:hypothetical protein [Crocinitomicaceae bacterium]
MKANHNNSFDIFFIFKVVYDCKFKELFKLLKANHNVANENEVQKEVVYDCKFKELFKLLKANHNHFAIDE